MGKPTSTWTPQLAISVTTSFALLDRCATTVSEHLFRPRTRPCYTANCSSFALLHFSIGSTPQIGSSGFRINSNCPKTPCLSSAISKLVRPSSTAPDPYFPSHPPQPLLEPISIAFSSKSE